MSRRRSAALPIPGHRIVLCLTLLLLAGWARPRDARASLTAPPVSDARTSLAATTQEAATSQACPGTRDQATQARDLAAQAYQDLARLECRAAADEALQATKLDGENATAYALAGIALLNLGLNQSEKEKQSIAASFGISSDLAEEGDRKIQKAGELDPGLALYFVALGTRDCIDAQSQLVLIEGREISKNSKEIKNSKAIKEVKQKLEQAVEAFATATKRDPQEALALTGRGYSLWLQGRIAARLERDATRADSLFKEAEIALKEVLGNHPDLVTARYYLAQLYLEKQQWAQAEQAFGQVKPEKHEQNPDLARAAYIGLALACAHQGKYEEAQDAVQEAARLGVPGNHWIYDQLKRIRGGEQPPVPH